MRHTKTTARQSQRPRAELLRFRVSQPLDERRLLGLDLQEGRVLLLVPVELGRLLGDERLQRAPRLVAVLALREHAVAHADRFELLRLDALRVRVDDGDDVGDERAELLVLRNEARARLAELLGVPELVDIEDADA
eukprot:CAMPEP_0185714284 /NCGR_PEP_ID=MMETSP1164-20130828/38467_1 /TAXON_ID=1104430 /ORGANISM="Chrysoreinhardia sp, Strain CCMP2950" /LENGTH=135 /DNA_ID=CAMNT_0028381865 /DNA_START=152 /DNA_END=555 /DNA_ORIENTATION=+